MEKSAWVAAGLTATVVATSLGYLTLDAMDVVPGFITTRAPEARVVQPPTLPGLEVNWAESASPLGEELSDEAVAAIRSAVRDFSGATVFGAREITQEPASPAEQGESAPPPTVRSVPAARTGVVVIDSVTGEQIAGANEATPLTPASTLKTLAGMTVLGRVGAAKTLTTEVMISGETLYLRGGGDIYLAEDAGDPKAVEGRAGLGDLARQTAQILETMNISGVALFLDDTLFDPESDWNPNWAGSEGYVGKITPLAMHGTFEPEVGYYSDPAMSAAEVFSQRLTEAGITVKGDLKRMTTPSAARLLTAVESAPVFDLVSKSLKDSNNTSTEVECRLAAIAAGKPATFDGATQAVQEFLQQAGVDTTGLVMDDCSGLSDRSKVTPKTLVSVLQVSRRSTQFPQLHLFDSALALAALDGTLDHRYLEDTPLLRAKTGSLSTVASLAGTLVTRSGRPLDFAIISDGFPEGSLYGARAAIDELIYAISEQ